MGGSFARSLGRRLLGGNHLAAIHAQHQGIERVGSFQRRQSDVRLDLQRVWREHRIAQGRGNAARNEMRTAQIDLAEGDKDAAVVLDAREITVANEAEHEAGRGVAGARRHIAVKPEAADRERIAMMLAVAHRLVEFLPRSEERRVGKEGRSRWWGGEWRKRVSVKRW